MILADQKDLQVVGEADNGREAVEPAEILRPDVCVMNVTMPELNGIEATRRLLKVSPKTRVLALGKGYLSPEISGAVLEDYRKHVTNPIDLLSSREREVLQMIAENKKNKEIAAALNLGVYTVEAHRSRVMEKLNLHSIGELVRFALRNGLID